MKSILNLRPQVIKLGIVCFLVFIQAQCVFSETIVATPSTLAMINNDVVPGSIVLLESGTYKTAIKPSKSGTAEAPIIYKPAEGASPIFSNVSPAIYMVDKSYIQIEGLKFLNCNRFMRLESCSNITVENCDFENGPGWESCSLKTMGDYFTFRNNSLTNGTDLLSIQGGSFHLIEGNTFNTASHTCLVFMGVQNSVIRNNRLINPVQKLLEIFATRSREWEGLHRKSEHVLIENNIFGPNSHDLNYTGKEPSASWGTQFAGVKCIMRNNIFAGCEGGMDMCGYGSLSGEDDDPEAVFNNTNRVYSNTIYSNGQPGRYASGPGILLSHNSYTEYFDNIYMNNILYANRIFKDAHTAVDVPTVQIAFGSPDVTSDVGFYYNSIMAESAEDETVFWVKSASEGYTLDAFEAEYPDYSGNNIQGNPLFENETPDLVSIDRLDYVLKENSPCIDAGGFLTHAVGAGTGTSLQVEDAYFFTNGYGLIAGDTIQLEGQTERSSILSVDYSTGILTLETSLTWTDGQGVSMKYFAAGPDIGANEYGVPVVTKSEDLTLSTSFKLSAHPNPFSAKTTVCYELPQASNMKLVAYDITGKEVAQLVNGYSLAGPHTISWDASEYTAQQRAGDIYLLRLQADDFSKTIKIINQ